LIDRLIERLLVLHSSLQTASMRFSLTFSFSCRPVDQWRRQDLRTGRPAAGPKVDGRASLG